MLSLAWLGKAGWTGLLLVRGERAGCRQEGGREGDPLQVTGWLLLTREGMVHL